VVALTLLVPVRNGSRYLTRFIAQASRFASDIVALDDGSTDDTGSILAHSPKVSHVISRPVRPTFAGWDDLGNRNALLDHLTARNYHGWALFLDVDELLDEDDAVTLLKMIGDGTFREDTVYGLRVFRMVHDPEHYYKKPLIVYRLFYVTPGCRIAGERLHFHPVPQKFARETWRPTNLRIKHLSSLTAELREQRFSKYKEADPDNRLQGSYQNLLDEPLEVRRWADSAYETVFPPSPA
jgi:glycosyltransferase involved in cell wall biosynthesis